MTRFLVRLDVSGAHYAEATLDRIGSQHAPIVRELERNPVVAPARAPFVTPATGRHALL